MLRAQTKNLICAVYGTFITVHSIKCICMVTIGIAWALVFLYFSAYAVLSVVMVPMAVAWCERISLGRRQAKVFIFDIRSAFYTGIKFWNEI